METRFDSNASARATARRLLRVGEAIAWTSVTSSSLHHQLTSAMPTHATTAKGVQLVNALRKKPPRPSSRPEDRTSRVQDRCRLRIVARKNVCTRIFANTKRPHCQVMRACDGHSGRNSAAAAAAAACCGDLSSARQPRRSLRNEAIATAERWAAASVVGSRADRALARGTAGRAAGTLSRYHALGLGHVGSRSSEWSFADIPVSKSEPSRSSARSSGVRSTSAIRAPRPSRRGGTSMAAA